ncbi:DUF4430 domain-containing protein [Pirellulimonas nuda]|uniref:DUF4430 domain-containing protein n=1 Tax=Pirellulimonas nuda TaxID=2528009 RepID=UPI0018D43788|nr:DUF4430 domain-containing protein [Pirellulimonas nuda]
MNEPRDPSVRLVCAFSAVLLGLIAWYGWANVRSQAPAAPRGGDTVANGPVALESVALEIDAGAGPPVVREIPWRAGMTALDQLKQATQVEVLHGGSSAFLRSIGGLDNQGAAGRNWQFWVNGRFGEASAGATPLAPGDRVLWRFALSE